MRLVLAVALVCALPGLASHLVNDDYLHRALYQGAVPDYHRGAFSLYDFMGEEEQEAAHALRERGYMPWWSNDDLTIRFFRPIASATLAADMEIFGAATMPALAHSALYFVGAVCLVFVILGMVLSQRSATVGACVYAVAGCHAVPLSWIAARHVLVAAFFALAAIALHLAWRERGFRPGRWLALVALILGLGSSESTLGAVALIGCYELVGARGPWRDRLLALAPVALLALGYLAWYTSAGYGARGTALYINPLHDPGAFLAAAATRIPALLGDMLASLPSIAYSLSPELAIVMPILGLLALALTIGLYRAVAPALPDGDSRHLRWLALGSLAALLPVSGGIIGGRLLAIASLGSAGVLGSIFGHVFGRARTIATAARGRGVMLRAFGGLHVALFVGLGVLMHVGVPLLYRQVGAEQWRIARDSEMGCAPQSDVVLMASPDPSITSYAPAAMLLMGRSPMPRALWVLSMAAQDHRVDVLDEHRLRLSVVGSRPYNWWEWVHRDAAIEPGQRFQVGDMSIEVLAVENGGPSQLAVHFERRLDDPSLCFAQWRDGLLREFRLPAPGQREVLAFEPGPMSQ